MKSYQLYPALHLTVVRLLLSFCCIICCLPASAQRVIRGLVTDATNGEALSGVLVSVKGKNKNVTTDVNGRYLIELDRRETMLVFSHTGYRRIESEAALRTIVNVALDADFTGLDRMISTPLGVQRPERDRAYSVQTLSGTALNRAREFDFLPSLSAQVAGLQVVQQPSGSALLTLRGERVLRSAHDNQPLLVVDGVPVHNRFFGSARFGYQELDFGNGAAYLIPEDMESVTILKGAAAAALYGARGSNGAIMVATKNGANTKGIGVSFHSTLLFESVLRFPDYQNAYGQGLEGQFSFEDGFGGGLNDVTDESWGPAFSGQQLPQFSSGTMRGARGADVGNLFPSIGPVNRAAQLAARGSVDSTAWQPYPNNVHDLFQTSVMQSYHVGLSGSNAQGDFRLSYTTFQRQGILPNTPTQRHNLSLTTNYRLSQRLRSHVFVNYIRSNSDNRPALGVGSDNVMYLLQHGLPRSVDMNSLRDYWQQGLSGQNQFNFNYSRQNNPFFSLYENTNTQQTDRLYGNAALGWQFTEWLQLWLRTGTDSHTEWRTRRRAFSTQNALRGSYREEQIRYEEINTDVLLTAEKSLSESVQLFAAFGGNLMRQQLRITDVAANQLAAPGVFNLSNANAGLEAYNFRSRKDIQSLYATIQLGLWKFVHLDVNIRNDWQSTLPQSNRSNLSWAAGTALLLSDALGWDPQGKLSFAKWRLSYARTGSDPDPYLLRTTYQSRPPVLGSPAFSESAILANPDLRSEVTSSIETGIDIRFFDNRIGLDGTWYRSLTDHQILTIPLSIGTGYQARIINGGAVRSEGLEVVLHLAPIRMKAFRLDVDVNFTQQRSRLLRLYDYPLSGEPIQTYVIADRYVQMEARVGERVGNLYGAGFQTVSTDPDSPYFDASGQYIGQRIFDSTGKPIPSAAPIQLGNYNPDWMAGVRNTFYLKGFTLSLLADVRWGGVVYSHTQALGIGGGHLQESLAGRLDGYDLSKDGNGIIGQGVVQQPDGSFVPNQQQLSAREWHRAYTIDRLIPEVLTHNATFIKLREARLGFHLPNLLLGKLAVRDVHISVVGRNLLLITDVPHIDPETFFLAGNTFLPGIETLALPPTRSIGVNLHFRF